VQTQLKLMVTCLALATSLTAAGCGGQDGTTQPEPAAIPGPGGENGQPAASSAGSPTDQPAIDPLHPTVLIQTSLGSIEVRLDAEKAPLTVDNFLSYVASGHYDQTVFHQVIKDYPKVVLGGAFAADGTEKAANTPIINEAHNGLKNQRGAIAMARRPDAVDSATCHFFFNLTDNEMLDHKDRTLEGYGYCVFGRVVKGLEVLDKIGSVEVHDIENFERVPVDPVMIESIRLIR
jgi:cyclophilin family peptidyl-prolyl cis-trans isomerase